MRIFHITAKYKKEILLPKDLLDVLPKKLMFFTTAQFVPQKESLLEQLKAAGKDLVLVQMRHTVEQGQILGCSTTKIDEDCDAYLYVGDGDFHPQALKIGNIKPVYRYDPKAEKWEVFESEWIERVKQRRKGALAAFYSSKEIGVLVTTKSGQQRLKQALGLKNKYKDKNIYVMLVDMIAPEGLQDFPFIEVFINTACPRIGFDDFDKFSKPIINLDDVGVTW